jgi:hypothetical protein
VSISYKPRMKWQLLHSVNMVESTHYIGHLAEALLLGCRWTTHRYAYTQP